MDIVLIGAGGQLGLDCQRVLGKEHRLFTPASSELDLCLEDSAREYIVSRRPEVVINCGAYTAVDRCEEERRLCRQINGEGPGYLAKACRLIGSRIIHISSDYVFDGSKPVPHPYVEDDPVQPLSHYGRTKLQGEQAIAKQCNDYVIVRTAWLYSATGSNFLKTMLRLSLADPGAIRRVVNDQYGSLTWSHTLARQIGSLLRSDIQGIVHATSEGYSTWYEAAVYFLEKMGVRHRLVPCSTADYPTPARRPANSILKNSVLEESGLSVFRNWQQDLDIFVERHGTALLAELE